jgi:5,6-dimethylbenzimidazole synthase
MLDGYAADNEHDNNNSKQTMQRRRREKYLSLKLEGIMESAVNIVVTYDSTRFGPFVLGRTSIPETGIYSVCCAIQNETASRSREAISADRQSRCSSDWYGYYQQ